MSNPYVWITITQLTIILLIVVKLFCIPNPEEVLTRKRLKKEYDKGYREGNDDGFAEAMMHHTTTGYTPTYSDHRSHRMQVNKCCSPERPYKGERIPRDEPADET